MNLKKLKLLGVILDFLLAFPLHFLYDKVPCFLTSIIAPVNESIWEHMKIMFGSIIISSIIQLIIIKKKKLNYNNILISSFIAALFSIVIFLIIYLPIYYSIGEKLPLTLVIMLITFIIVEYMTTKIIKEKDLNCDKRTLLYILIVYLIFGLLTYFPPHIDLFLCPKDHIYGIKK